MGFRRFSHAYTEIVAALKAGDIHAARRALAGWRGSGAGDLSSSEVAKLAVERGLLDSYRQVFAALFWFTVLPGPAVDPPCARWSCCCQICVITRPSTSG